MKEKKSIPMMDFKSKSLLALSPEKMAPLLISHHFT
jgi:hypothetical protein